MTSRAYGSAGKSGSDVSGRAAGDAHELVERRREDVVRVAPGRPHLVELREVRVDDGAQGSGVANRGNAASGLCNPWLRRGGCDP